MTEGSRSAFVLCRVILLYKVPWISKGDPGRGSRAANTFSIDLAFSDQYPSNKRLKHLCLLIAGIGHYLVGQTEIRANRDYLVGQTEISLNSQIDFHS